MVDKKTQKQSQKQTVKQTVKVVIGDLPKRRQRKKRAVATKRRGLASTFIQPSAKGALSGGFSGYVPSSNVPFSSVAQAPISLALEARVKQLELKGDNPALNLSGSTAVKAQDRLENNSMASNEAFPAVIKPKKEKKEEELIPLNSRANKDFDPFMAGTVNVSMTNAGMPFLDPFKEKELNRKAELIKKEATRRRQEAVFNEMMRRVNTNPNAEIVFNMKQRQKKK